MAKVKKKAPRKRIDYRALYLEVRKSNDLASDWRDREIRRLKDLLDEHSAQARSLNERRGQEWGQRLRRALNDNQREAARITIIGCGVEYCEVEYAFEAALLLLERESQAGGGFKL